MLNQNKADLIGDQLNTILMKTMPTFNSVGGSKSGIYSWARNLDAYGEGEHETLFITEDHIYKHILSYKFENTKGLIGDAIRWARNMQGQDKAGDPIYLHAFRIASALDLLGYDQDHVITAILHDWIEEMGYTDDRITAEFNVIQDRYNATIADAVVALTRRKDERYFDYIDRLKSNHIALKVKQFDVYDHLFHKKHLSSSMIKRYEKASKMLNLRLSNGIIDENMQKEVK